MPDVEFSQYVVSLARGVLTGLGELPDPETNQNSKNLVLAEHSFSVLKICELLVHLIVVIKLRIVPSGARGNFLTSCLS